MLSHWSWSPTGRTTVHSSHWTTTGRLLPDSAGPDRERACGRSRRLRRVLGSRRRCRPGGPGTSLAGLASGVWRDERQELPIRADLGIRPCRNVAYLTTRDRHGQDLVARSELLVVGRGLGHSKNTVSSGATRDVGQPGAKMEMFDAKVRSIRPVADEKHDHVRGRSPPDDGTRYGDVRCRPGCPSTRSRRRLRWTGVRDDHHDRCSHDHDSQRPRQASLTASSTSLLEQRLGFGGWHIGRSLRDQCHRPLPKLVE